MALPCLVWHAPYRSGLPHPASRVGSTTVSLSLLTPGGRPLPGRPVTMTIRATHFGTLALVILAAALGVFMITSAGRAIRRGSSGPRRADPPSSGGLGAERPVQAGEADSVVADHADQGTSDFAAAADDRTEDTDEFARAPGWADEG